MVGFGFIVGSPAVSGVVAEGESGQDKKEFSHEFTLPKMIPSFSRFFSQRGNDRMRNGACARAGINQLKLGKLLHASILRKGRLNGE